MSTVANKIDCCVEPDKVWVIPRPHDMNWLSQPVTDDQKCMNEFITTQDIECKRILHIGIGNSSVALLPNMHKANKVIGITIANEECEFGNNLKLENQIIILN